MRLSRILTFALIVQIVFSQMSLSAHANDSIDARARDFAYQLTRHGLQFSDDQGRNLTSDDFFSSSINSFQFVIPETDEGPALRGTIKVKNEFAKGISSYLTIYRGDDVRGEDPLTRASFIFDPNSNAQQAKVKIQQTINRMQRELASKIKTTTSLNFPKRAWQIVSSFFVIPNAHATSVNIPVSLTYLCAGSAILAILSTSVTLYAWSLREGAFHGVPVLRNLNSANFVVGSVLVSGAVIISTVALGLADFVLSKARS